MSNFLANSERFIKRYSPNNDFAKNMINAYNWYLSMNDPGLHIIGARMALYNFHKHPAHRLAFWKLYLQHKNEFFRVFTSNK